MAMAAALVTAAAAIADERIDRRIDEAAARIVAQSMGDLRGTIPPGERPVMIRSADVQAPASARWRLF